MVAVWLACTAAILCLLAAAGYILTSGEDGLPAILTLGALHALRRFLVDEELRTLDADTTEDLLNHLEELDLIDWSGQVMMTEMARAAVIIEAAGSAQLTVFQDTHARIRQTSNLSFLRDWRCHFHHGPLDNVFVAKNRELDANQ